MKFSNLEQTLNKNFVLNLEIKVIEKESILEALGRRVLKVQYSPETVETAQNLASWCTSVLRCSQSLVTSLACEIKKVKGARVGKMKHF